MPVILSLLVECFDLIKTIIFQNYSIVLIFYRVEKSLMIYTCVILVLNTML